MLFRRKIRCSIKYQALTDTYSLVVNKRGVPIGPTWLIRTLDFSSCLSEKRAHKYRAVLFKWEFIIQMRDAVSQPSLDIEESYFSKNTLFLFKNDFLFYYLKLYIPSVPLIWVFEAFFGPPFCSLTKGKEEKDGSSKVGSRGKSGSVCLAAALIWMINSNLNRTSL